MAKFGVNLKIDVSKIVKERMFKGEKGTYLDCTVFIDVDNQGQYGDNGMITQAWKDQQKGEGPILGNAKVFWRDDNAPAAQSAPQAGYAAPAADFDDGSDIPF